MEFDLLLRDKFIIYICSMTILLIPYSILYKKKAYGGLEPLTIAFIFSFFSSSTALFMYYTDYINSYYGLSFIITQISLMLGMIIVKKEKKKSLIIKSMKRKYIPFFLILYIVSNMVIFMNIGLPILNSNRLYRGNNIGIFILIKDITTDYLIFLIMLQFVFQKKFNKIILLVVLVFSMLYGSKFFIFELILWYFIVKIFTINNSSKQITLLSFRNFKVMIIAIVGSLIISKIQGFNPFNMFVKRLVYSGDAFIFAYKTNIFLHEFNLKEAFIGIFRVPLSTFRIIDRASIPEGLGVIIKRVYFDNPLATGGPNPRHNIFGLYYFGFYGSLIYSFLLGVLIIKLRNFAINKKAKNIYSLFICGYIFKLSPLLISDLDLFMGGIIRLLLFMMLYQSINLVNICLPKKIKEEEIYDNRINSNI